LHKLGGKECVVAVIGYDNRVIPELRLGGKECVVAVIGYDNRVIPELRTQFLEEAAWIDASF
jgi:hypothetical protein